ncbi:MAG TPA: hypothetical protein VJI33_01800 [Candidatus Paceibacterota bacterium]
MTTTQNPPAVTENGTMKAIETTSRVLMFLATWLNTIGGLIVSGIFIIAVLFLFASFFLSNGPFLASDESKEVGAKFLFGFVPKVMILGLKMLLVGMTSFILWIITRLTKKLVLRFSQKPETA